MVLFGKPSELLARLGIDFFAWLVSSVAESSNKFGACQVSMIHSVNSQTDQFDRSNKNRIHSDTFNDNDNDNSVQFIAVILLLYKSSNTINDSIGLFR